jgi:ribosomal protein S18 acetylase RimI-like enzyme
VTENNETYFATYRARSDRGAGERPPDLVIRPAEVKDAEGLAVLKEEREGGSAAEHREGFLAELAGGGADRERMLLVAECGGALAGFARAALFRPAPDAPARTAPAGWFLAGLYVTPAWRGRGIGAKLTEERLRWLAGRAGEIFYFVNARNRSSIALHAGFGFEEMTREFEYPGVTFTGGVGILFRLRIGDRHGRV